MSSVVASRRLFLRGLTASLVTAPAIVRAASLMPVRVVKPLHELVDILNERIAASFVLTKQNIVANLYGGSVVIEPTIEPWMRALTAEFLHQEFSEEIKFGCAL